MLPAVILVLAMLVASLLTFLASTMPLRPFYGGSAWEAFWTHLQIALGSIRGFQIIDDGRTILPAASGALLGPRRVIIRPGNAVIMERGASQRAVGPSRFTSASYEYVKLVYDMREHQRPFDVENVLTSDLIPTEVKVVATFTLDISDQARWGDTELSTAEQHLLLHMPYTMPDWQNATQDVLEQCIREVISTATLNALLSPANLGPFELSIRNRANLRTSQWGVRVTNVILQCLQPKPRLTEAAESRWVATTETDTIIATERARAAGMRDALRVLADGYRTAQAMGMTDAQIHREVLRRTLEHMARDPATKIVFTPELSKLLTSLRR